MQFEQALMDLTTQVETGYGWFTGLLPVPQVLLGLISENA